MENLLITEDLSLEQGVACIAPDKPMIKYFDFRLTLDEDVYEQSSRKFKMYSDITISWFNWLIEKNYIADRATAGFEVLGKTGDNVKPHFHIRMSSYANHAAVRKAIREKFRKDYDQELKGNHMYMFKIIADPDHEQKFFRYPLKQQEGKPLIGKGFTQGQLKDMCVAAIANYKTTCEVNIKKQERHENNDTLYDRLEQYLDKKGCTLENILKFYVEEEKKPINDQTIVGYFNLYRLRRQIITYSAYSLKIKSKYNL